MARREWVRLPSAWIEGGGLQRLRWNAGEWSSGANCSAALMTLAIIAHSVDEETGLARVSYDYLTEATGLSRSKVSAGLNILADLEVIIRAPAGRSSFQLTHYDLSEPWCKIPARGLYSGDRIPAFCDF